MTRRPAVSAPRPQLAPTLTELVPWTDRRGRFHPMRAFVLTLLVMPGLYLAGRWAFGMLGAEPVTAAIHATGYWAIWILVASLVISPLKTLGGSPNIVVVRRMIGNAALIYAVLHLLLYAMDQKWQLLTIVSEILRRFYLTIGFVALLGLLALGFTSTDGFVRHLGKAWKRLHRLVYALTVLGIVHYVLQSKLDVSHALLALGVFAWLMLWRTLPAGRDRAWPWLLATTAAAVAVTLASEYLWYRFGTRINPGKVFLEEFDVTFGVHPGGQVLILGLLATLLVALHQAGDTRLGRTPAITMAAYALGAIAGEAAPWFFGLELGTVAMDDPWSLGRATVWVLLLAIPGWVRWRLAESWQKHLVDAVWIACILYDVARLTTDDIRVVSYGGASLVALSVLLAARLWPTARTAVLVLLPLTLLLAAQAVLA